MSFYKLFLSEVLSILFNRYSNFGFVATLIFDFAFFTFESQDDFFILSNTLDPYFLIALCCLVSIYEAEPNFNFWFDDFSLFSLFSSFLEFIADMLSNKLESIT